MLYKLLTLCTILTSYVNFLIISLYIYNILSIFIELYFEEYFHLIFWKGFFIHRNIFNTNYNILKSCMSTKSFNKLINTYIQ
jgi:hypothetical protein